MITNKKIIVIFTGPSGVGKSSVEKKLFDYKELNLEFSVSATTRKPRKCETEGIDYYFVTNDKFEENITHDSFIEWNEHFNNKYGTLKNELTRIFNLGKIPFLEVEVNGAENVAKQFKSDEHISIFLAPPNFIELERRIRLRNTESEQQIQKRLKRAKMELSIAKKFDYTIINDVPSRAANEIKDIIEAKLK